MGEEIGEVTHYFGKIQVAIVKLAGSLKKGEEIHIKGNTTDFSQKADSMQVDHKDVEEASKGDEIGLKVDQQVREGDKVYRAE